MKIFSSILRMLVFLGTKIALNFVYEYTERYHHCFHKGLGDQGVHGKDEFQTT